MCTYKERRGLRGVAVLHRAVQHARRVALPEARPAGGHAPLPFLGAAVLEPHTRAGELQVEAVVAGVRDVCNGLHRYRGAYSVNDVHLDGGVP